MIRKPRSRSDEKREAIIDAATNAFKTFGVAGTSMNKLAEMAGVSKRTVYNHFTTKEELVMHLIHEQWENAQQKVNLQYDSSQALTAQLHAIILQKIEFIVTKEHLDIARVAIGHFFYEPDKLKDEVAQLSAQETTLHQWLKAAQADNKLQFDDINVVVSQIDGVIKGRCFWPQLLKIEDQLSTKQKLDIAQSTAALILSHYSHPSISN